MNIKTIKIGDILRIKWSDDFLSELGSGDNSNHGSIIVMLLKEPLFISPQIYQMNFFCIKVENDSNPERLLSGKDYNWTFNLNYKFWHIEKVQ